MSFSPSRVAVYLTALAGLLAAVAPMVAELQTDDMVGLVSGLLAIVIAVVKWLDGRSKWETTELAKKGVK